MQCCVVSPLSNIQFSSKSTEINENLSEPGCKWSKYCYGVNYGHGYVCKKEFGAGYSPSRKIGCSGLGMTMYECCS